MLLEGSCDRAGRLPARRRGLVSAAEKSIERLPDLLVETAVATEEHVRGREIPTRKLEGGEPVLLEPVVGHLREHLPLLPIVRAFELRVLVVARVVEHRLQALGELGVGDLSTPASRMALRAW